MRKACILNFCIEFLNATPYFNKLGNSFKDAKLAISTMSNALLLLCIYGFSSTVSGVTATPNAEKNSTRHVVTFIRDSDYKCTQCHKDPRQTLWGTHGEAVTKYSAAQSKQAKNKHQLNFDSILSSRQIVVHAIPQKSCVSKTGHMIYTLKMPPAQTAILYMQMVKNRAYKQNPRNNKLNFA